MPFNIEGKKQQEVADIYLRSADELFDPRDDQEKPDYERANDFLINARR